MKKKILCFILAVIMLLGSLPLTVLANEARAASTQSDAPMVKVSSQYHEKLQNSDEVRVLPDENGVFTVTISLTEKMTRGQSLEIYYEIEDGTAKVGNAFAEDGTVVGGDYLGAFADQSAVDHKLVEQAHVGTKGTIGIPYNISSFELKIYSNVLDTNEDKSFTFRLTGVKNKNNYTHYVLSETERELTCYLRTTPTVSVSSVYSENGRVIPNEYGKFFFDISLDWNPTNGDEIFVYYRTIDDTAVAEWGDYVGVGYPEDTYVTLNQANNYTARVTVQSVITEEGFYEVPSRLTDPQLIVSRKFVFDLYRVEGNAIMTENSAKTKSSLDCYLRAERYHPQGGDGKPGTTRNPIVSLTDEKSISTPECKNNSRYKADLNITFPDYFKNYAQAGFSNVGVAIYGDCFEGYWNSDGAANFDLYYTYEGVKRKALTLYMEGEFDDSTFYGWELAFDYMKGNYYREMYDGIDIDDYMEDNFVGFTLYDNDGNVAFTTLTSDGKKGSLYSICEKLQQAITQGYAVQNKEAYYDYHPYGNITNYYLYYLKLPSNFMLADSYSYEFTSITDDHKRYLDHVAISFYLSGPDSPKIVTEKSGAQMVATNIGQLKEGDPLRMSIRFDQPVRVDEYFGGYVGSFKITAMINGEYPVTLYYTGGKNSLDTLSFAGELPEEVKNIKIHSVTSIKIDNGSTNGIKSFLEAKELYSKKINDLLNRYDADLRTPVATVSVSGTEGHWTKSKSVDIYVWEENKKSRFLDYVTVYYEWSNSPQAPKIYNHKLAFHMSKDQVFMKSIVGTGNGKMFLHLKTVSRYGKETTETIGVVEVDGRKEGAYWFDNAPPSLELTEETFNISGSLSAPTFRINAPQDACGWQTMALYRKGDTTPLKVIKVEDFNKRELTLEQYEALPTSETYEGLITFEGGKEPQYNFTIQAQDVGVGLGGKMERKEIEFYWIFTDKLGNVSEETASFSFSFDTNDYLDKNEISSVGAYDSSTGEQIAQFGSATEKLDDLTYIYDYSKNRGKAYQTHSSGKTVYYAFYFQTVPSAFDGGDNGNYTVSVKYRGTPVGEGDVTLDKVDENGLYVVWFHQALESGQYEIQLIRTENESKRVSQIHSVYATNDENDDTPGKVKVEIGTLLVNTIYQLSTDDPYFYYMDATGASQKQYYNNTRQPASFSNISKAKEYVYYMELNDIYLVQLTSITAIALNTNTPGFLKAQGESTVAQEGDYWIRYKSATWEPGSNKNSWVYYYYGKSGDLQEASLSTNVKNALNNVANRIVGYGKSVILTDTSLLLGTVTGDKMLDKYGMPYLYEGQTHAVDESSYQTIAGSTWRIPVVYAADKNIYRSNMYVGEEGSAEYREYPIVGNFTLSEDSFFQYMDQGEHGKGDAAKWWQMNLKKEETFVDFFKDSGIYYIREISKNGVAVYSICIDKTSPSVEFYYYDITGTRRELAVDGVQIQEINAREVIIGDILDTDRLSYISVYNSQLKLVAMHNAEELAISPLKLENGKYYIVVSDRSGNHYTVTAKVSNTSLQCQIKESSDRFIKLTCNRRDDEILRYEVYLNGQLLTSAYSADQNFTSAGTYNILIQDIYGNSFNEEVVFYRNYPEVTWKYRGADGKYHAYDPHSVEADGFIMTQTSDNQYKISTSVETRLSFSGNYAFEFIGAAPKYTQTVTAETTVTIEAGQSFTLKVYYKDYPDNYVIFSGVVDVTPPTVNILAETNLPRNGEYSLFDRWLENGTIGDVIDLEDLYYVAEVDQKIVSNNETVSSSLIKIDVSDANNLYLVEVYLDDEMVRHQDAETGFSQIVVSRWGKYRIVAKDALGNVSEVSFTNGQPEHFDYLVDGEKKDFLLDAYLNFETVEGKKVYTKSEYGNSSLQLDLKQNADVFLSVDMTDGEGKIYGFRIKDGNIYPLVYKIVEKDNSAKIELQVGSALVNTAADDFVADREYLLNNDGRPAIYASVSKQNLVTLKVYAPTDASKIVSVSARLEFSDNHTMFVSAKLSKKTSEITFKDVDGNAIVGFQTGTDIRANKGFTIDEHSFESEFVSDIKLYYSKLNDLVIDSLSQRKSVYESDGEYEAEGFYLLVVKNLFGNERIYRIAISRSFGITSSVVFSDGETIYHSKNYNETLYSNNEIILDILDENVSYAVTKDEVAFSGFEVRSADGITYLVFLQEGSYEVTLTDSYGNVIVRQLQINRSAYTLSEDLLTGYNEKALKRDEGYTNQKLSVDKAVYDRDGIFYLAIEYGESLAVLFDSFSENAVSTDVAALTDIIGAQGDGVYKVICRNRYGAVVTKNIHYRGTPTLKLERTTRSESEPMVYDLKDALSVGFWSNNTLSFSTDAKTYVFTIDGNTTECPRTLVFENAGDFGSFEYEITYVDEYGFEYSFKAYLFRNNVTVNLPSSITCTDIGGVLNTKDNIAITFDDKCYATYTINNGESFAYRSGDVLKKDGTYRFTVIDFAGNVTTYTIKKDTAVEFSFTETATDNMIQNGSVVNSSKVSFNALNKDSAYIEKVILNGVVQTDFEGSKFNEDGKWEVILADKLGNKAYFSFYIITRSKNGFAYTTPYEYRITEMWYDSGDGIRVSYLNFVNHTDRGSSFDFKENGTYTVVMVSDTTGMASTFHFTVNTKPSDAILVGCADGETTINDVTLTGCKVGDRIMVYTTTEKGEVLVEKIEVTSPATKMPIISEGGEYRIVVESEAGVATEFNFVRKHVMNTAGSIFIMVVIGLAVVGLFTGLVYRNKSKTDD